MIHPARRSRSSGHTLVELLATLGLVAILIVLAAPAFITLRLDGQRDAALRSALHAVHAARQFAAVRGEDMRLCGSRDQRACSGGTDWSAGLLVTSATGDLHRSLAGPAAGGGLRLRANRVAASFAGGTAFATPLTLVACDRRGPAAARALIVSRSGRPRISDRDASGGPLPC